MPDDRLARVTPTPARRDEADEHLERWRDLFPDPDARAAQVESALNRINTLTREQDLGLRRLLADHPLSYEEFLTLHALIGQSRKPDAPVTPAQLAARTGITRAGMTSRLDRLERAGLIGRDAHPADRRSTRIVATGAGMQAWERVIHHWQEREQASLEVLTDRELATLNTLLRKIALRIEQP